MRHPVFFAAVLAASALPATAQTAIRIPSRPAIAQAFASTDDPKRAMLGISTSSSGRRDTLGLLVTSVTAGGPAEKAGLEEGNRLVSINGVSLRLSREDADDDYMQGVNQNRLQREMRKVKAGEDVKLEVYGGGRSRQVTIKTVSAEDLSPKRTSTWTTRDDDRVALGLYLTTTGSKRDTAGVFVQQVVDGGPADKAGIYEGDRIASINGVDLRVPREDAGDWSVSSSRVDRLEREVRKLTVGQAADLVVVSGGRSRNVKLTAVKAADLPGGYAYSFRTGPGGMGMIGPQGNRIITVPPSGAMRAMPKIRIQRGSDGFEHFDGFDKFEMFDKSDFGKDFKLNFDKDFKFDFDFDKFAESFRDFGLKFKDFDRKFENFDWDRNHKYEYDDDREELRNLGPKIRAEIQENLDRELPRKIDALRDLGPRIRAEIDNAIRDGRVIRKYDGPANDEVIRIKDKIVTRG
jgi:S1-C subfamily serine protease